MDEHRVRLVNYPDDPVPVKFVEITLDSWLPLINVPDNDPKESHAKLHEFINQYDMNERFFIMYDTSCFNRWFTDYKELPSLCG